MHQPPHLIDTKQLFFSTATKILFFSFCNIAFNVKMNSILLYSLLDCLICIIISLGVNYIIFTICAIIIFFQENELTSITGGGSLSDLQDLHVSVFRPIFIFGTTDTVQRNCAFDSRTEICSFTHPIPILFTLANIQSRLTNQPTQMQWINLQYFHINTYAIKT